MPDSCIKRRLLFACREAYRDKAPAAGGPVGWVAAPRFITAGVENIDRVLVGRVAEGIVVAFRGTQAPSLDGPAESITLDWLNNARFLPANNPTYPGSVHEGFAHSIHGLWDPLKAEIARLLPLGDSKRLFVTGHSKGGALANLFAWRAIRIPGLQMPIRVFTIAAARAGNEDFRIGYTTHGAIECTRYETAFDVVPYLPFGADTPARLKRLIQQVWKHVLDTNYVPVGSRMPVHVTLTERLQAAARYFRWLGIGGARTDYLPLIAQAHDIGSRSGYDLLICDGDPGCTHR